MAKGSKNVGEPTELILTYDLFSLPSAQHKAGLAGLLLLIESLNRRKVEPIPEIVGGPSATSVRLKLAPNSLRTLYDDFFAPVTIQQPTKEGKTKEKTFPRGEFLDALGLTAPWLALWRNVITNVVRAGAPAQFKPYRDRREGSTAPTEWDWKKMWDALSADKTAALSASDYLGAEATHADAVPFKDRERDSFLLTFAPIVSLPYISQSLKRDKTKDGKTNYHFQRNAYVIVTPEVARLDSFVSRFPDLLANLDSKTWGKDPYPAAARVSVPAEGGLEFLASHRVVGEKSRRYLIADAVVSVQVTHLEYGKGSPHLLHIGSLANDSGVLDEYVAFRKECWNYLYRELRVRNLLNRDPWYTGVDAVFAEHPAEIFIEMTGKTPQFPFFGADVVRTLRGIHQDLQQMKGAGAMADEWKDEQLASRIYLLIKQYVDRRTKDKCDMTWDDFKNKRGDMVLYRETREKVCLDAFLALRGRDDADLVSYFAGTICAVPQSLNHERFLTVSEHLLTNPAKVKTLAMLALSAHSYLWGTSKSNTSETKGASE